MSSDAESQQKHLRRQIVAIQADSDLKAEEKSRRIFAVLNPWHYGDGHDEDEDSGGLQGEGLISPYDGKLGCTHYKRRVWVHPPGEPCRPGGFFSCRLCHEGLDRFKVKFMKCQACLVSQAVHSSCRNPQCTWYKKPHHYYCDTCHLWSDDVARPIFHCHKCGLCRVGDAADYRHCDLCSLCVHKTAIHHCAHSSRDFPCPVCMDPLHDSTNAIVWSRCGHMFHGSCLEELLSTSYRCPICKKAMVNMQEHWQSLDAILSSQPSQVPEQFRTWKVDVFCNDCSAISTVPFAIEYYKCTSCGSYNTAQQGRNERAEQPPQI